jgi:hypothetical protein
MTLEEFIKRLDRTNPFFEAFEQYIWAEHLFPTLFAAKGSDLPEVMMTLLAARKFPLVDKRLGMVFGLLPDKHEDMRAYLETYHEATLYEGPFDKKRAAVRYMREGRGYYVSSTRDNMITTCSMYRPDLFDKDLFRIMKVHQTI